MPSSDGGDDLVGVLGPAEGARVVVGSGDVTVDGCLERDEGMEHAALEPLLCELGEETLDGVHPGRRGRREMEREARMPAEPLDHLGVLVGGVVVQDHVDQLARGHLALDGVEEADEFLVAVALHAAPDHAAREHVERREQRGRAVALVVMRHGAAAPALERQPRLGAVERLDLALFVHRQHHGMGRRVEVEADDVAQLGREVRVIGQLELTQPVRLQAVRRARCAAPS